MKLDRLAVQLFTRAYRDATLAPGDAQAHERFAAWARVVSRIIGVPISGWEDTDGEGRARWVRVTAGLLLPLLVGNYAVSLLLSPGKPKAPAPPSSAVGQLITVMASTADTGAPYYFTNTVTGQQFRGYPPFLGKPTTKIGDT
jgi:hypothetical protein